MKRFAKLTDPALCELMTELELSIGLSCYLQGTNYIFEVDGVPAGFITFTIRDLHTLEIKHIYVRPEYRLLGIASKMIEWAKEYKEQENYRYLVLAVKGDNRDALGFYIKKGFVPSVIEMELS